MQKTITYEKVPDFDQSKFMVIQTLPKETEDNVYYGIKLIELPKQEELENIELLNQETIKDCIRIK